MNKKIFITGGAGGLGTAIAKRHLNEGDTVWALDLAQSPELEALQKQSDKIFFIPCDISKTQYVKAALNEVCADITALDYLYSCAGIYLFEDKVKLAETNLDKAAFMYDINAVGFLRVVQALLSVIKSQTNIICITSEAGSIGENRRSGEYNYCMSKAAENMACALLQAHFEEQQQKTRVICLHPGWLRTKMGGPDAFKLTEYSVDPQVSANAIVDIALDISNIPPEHRFMDYKRTLIKW